MLIEVIKMRREGVKLSAEELAAQPCLSGHLLISHWMWAQGSGLPAVKVRHASLHGFASCLPQAPEIASLHFATVTHWRGDQFVITGEESVGPSHERRKFMQAWLCTIPGLSGQAGQSPF